MAAISENVCAAHPTNLRQDMVTAVREAGAVALRYFGRTTVQLKADDTVVTEADREVERDLETRLAAIMPGAAFVGEEQVGSGQTMAVANTHEWIWVVDPIDGTAAFSDGIGTFCVCVGLLRNGKPYAGAVYLPAFGNVYSAVAGEGAFYDDTRIRVLDNEPVPDKAVLYVTAKAHREFRISYAGKTRSLGSTALHCLLVARGAAVGALGKAYAWDFAAAVAVLQEAGGVFRHLDGTEIDWITALDGRQLRPPVLSAAPSLWHSLVAVIEPLEVPS